MARFTHAVIIAATLLMNLCGVSSQEEAIEDIRLVNGTYGSHMGRVEVSYNGTWGTICNRGWSYNDARVACRELGFVAVVCFVGSPPAFPPPNEDTPVWINNVSCRGAEASLGQCPYEGFGVESCPQIGGEVICAQRGIVGKTTNVTQVEATSTIMTLTWNLPPIPQGAVQIRWRVQGFGADRYPRTNNVNVTSYSFSVSNLSPDTPYTIRVRTDVRYSFCRRSFLFGDFSDELVVRTTNSTRMSAIPIRLVPPFPGLNFLGRVEVQYNNTWGTVCDDNIRSLQLAHIVCRARNFTRALCGVNAGRYGPGSGPIWMDNVVCRNTAELLDDCNFPGWGVHNCDHSDDYSVVCQPTQDDVGSVTDLRVVNTGPTNADLAWNAFPFPPGTTFSNYLITYRRQGIPTPTSIPIASTRTTARVNRLLVNTTYTFSIRARYRMNFCVPLIVGRASGFVRATTMERAPGGPPTSVHLVVLNQSAVEVQWNLPLLNLRNGEIRGFKIFYQESGSASESMVDVADGDAVEYIVSGLKAGTVYTFSVLAYTGADGPRSIHLSVSTFSDDYVELIVTFGLAANGLDRIVRNVGQRGFNVLCGSGTNNVQLSWFFPNQTEIPSNNLGIRQGRNTAGTAILAVGVRRTVQYCDAGSYTCRATLTTNTTQVTQSRIFTFLIGFSPPAPSSPYIISRGSTWVTLGWNELSCDGGHVITEFIIRYQMDVADFFVTSYSFVYGVDPALRNYTIHNLDPQTPYKFSIQAQSAEFRASSFSAERTINTLVAAPSAPQHVRARLVQTPVVEVMWREPSSPNGIIAYYTIYASSGFASFGNVQSPLSTATPTVTIASMRVPGHIGAANITVPAIHDDVQFQVSATVEMEELATEGERSLVTLDSIVFVPSAVLPVPRNFEVVDFDNTTVRLSWTYPVQNTRIPILQFKVEYAADVFWMSPGGFLVEFGVSGFQNVSSDMTAVTITGLLPGTEYYFRVSALTDVGQGGELTILQETAPPLDDKVRYFQLKVHSISNCFQWKLDPSAIPSIRTSIVEAIVARLCDSCDIITSNVQDDSLRCDPTAPDHAVYSARLVGSGRLSPGSMLSFLEHWVLSEAASVTVAGMMYGLDSTCPTQLDSPMAPVCSLTLEPTTLLPDTTSAPPSTTPTSSPPTSSPPTRTLGSTRGVVVIKEQSSSISSGEVGGLVIGVIIIVLLVVFVVLLVALLARSFLCSPSKVRMKKLNEEVVFTPNFAQDTELAHENPFYGEPKEKDDVQ